jgi:CBS-domain-containing membrane protein
MSDLRDAAELALTALENTCPNTWTSVKENLRKALAQPEPVHAIDISQERVDETAKRKREWVGLTDEEIENLWEMAQAWNAPKHFYILIAAKLKEKNT